MTEQDKVTVDDIIGIVKTEEQTNSVEEVRKLRGRGNETAKRFILSDFFWEVLDTKYDWLGNTEPFSEEVIEEEDYLLIGRARTQEDGEGICKLLNKLIEENEQLKAQLKDCEYRITDKEVEWLRNNTVWEQMPTNIKTKTNTSDDTRDKVELEDIIGIVKTDERTNSVELKKELYK